MAKKKTKAKVARRKKARAAKASTKKVDFSTEELDQLIMEHSALKDQRDALDEMLEQRKSRILLLMRDGGLSKREADAGEASFSERRSFTVHDPSRLAELFSPKQLAANVRITAEVYDAAKAEGIDIDDAVRVGIAENLSVSRARSKEANKRRKALIAESKKQAESRMSALRASMRKRA